LSNPLRDLLAERNRAAELARLRQLERSARENLPTLIDERVGEQMEKLESKLVEGFREMGRKVVEQGTEALTSSLDGRISQLEQISQVQTDNVNRLRDSSRIAEQKVSGVVNSIENALSEAVPGFRLSPLSHLPPQLTPATETGELVTAQDRSVEDLRIPNAYCPKCTSTNVRRATRTGMWEEFLRLFFIAPFRCRACRHKFYRF
jgi:ABC-type transporter Mla subunit MlaD